MKTNKTDRIESLIDELNQLILSRTDFFIYTGDEDHKGFMGTADTDSFFYTVKAERSNLSETGQRRLSILDRARKLFTEAADLDDCEVGVLA